jgi:hypothetical protein
MTLLPMIPSCLHSKGLGMKDSFQPEFPSMNAVMELCVLFDTRKGGCAFEVTVFLLTYNILLLQKKNGFKIFNFDVKVLSD